MGNVHIGNKTTNNFCFPPDETVVTPTGQRQTMRDSKVGDEVLVVRKDHTVKTSKIISFAHDDVVGQAEYYKFEAKAGNSIKSVEMTGDHIILVRKQGTVAWKYLSAKLVELGDTLLALEEGNQIGENQFGEVIVSSITKEIKQGFFAPITEEGTIVVGNGFAASCYAVGNSHEATHLALKLADLAFGAASFVRSVQSAGKPQVNDAECD